MSLWLPILLVILLALSIGLFLFAVLVREDVRIQRTSEYLEVKRQLAAPSFRKRVVSPLAASLVNFLSHLYPAKTIERLDDYCEKAGRPLGLAGKTLAVSKVIFAICAWFFATAFIRGRFVFPASIVAAGIGYAFPGMWISSRIKSRTNLARAQLADVMDLLVVSVEAGLGLDAALQRVAARFRKPLGELFSKAIAEISLGSSREAAFRGISETLPFNELKSFTGSIIQAERLGTSIAAVLRSQAASLRKHRRLRAEEHARKAPVKILFPLVIFIFPSIFVIILGPAMIEIIASLKL
jgi:tight adherence protein C